MTDRSKRPITPGKGDILPSHETCKDYGEFSGMCYFNMKVSSSVGYPVGQRYPCYNRIKMRKCPRGYAR